jgi:thiopurine S-methyltransferase
VKAVNQVLVAGSYAAVAEALALGRRLGLPMAEVCAALQEGAADSWALRHRAEGMLAGRFPPGFRLALHHKDLRIALEAAAATGLTLPVSERVAAMEAELMAAGHGHDDVSALARWFEPAAASGPAAAAWDQRYREGRDGWELGAPAPPLAAFLRDDPRRPRPPGRVLVPGCGRGHEAALLAELGFAALGLDLSGEALREARRRHGPDRPELRWHQADLLDPEALRAAGLADGSLQGVVEHTCFCALEPSRRPDYLRAVTQLLAPGSWLLGLFWCHDQPGGPPFGSHPGELESQLRAAGLEPLLWEPARGSAAGRNDEWLGLWRL